MSPDGLQPTGATAEEHVRHVIRREGPITFARFMELAFYSPGGYYSSRHPGGARGDYFTSPAAHPAFGALVAIQLEQVWAILGCPGVFAIVEPGAGDGLLCQAIVSYAEHLAPGFRGALRYLCLDRLPPPAERLRGASAALASNLPVRRVVGCILSNELLDALPVHRFHVQAGRVREVYVGLEGDRFTEVLGEPSTPLIGERLERLGLSLAEGFRGEVNLALEGWSQEAAAALERGLLLTIDYGGLASELYAPARARGTLRCYYRHTVSANPYVRVSQQDITAHVDFSALMEAGERAGLTTLGYATQRAFLMNLGWEAFLRALQARGLPHTEYLANRMGMEEVVRPGGLGEFRVLAQGKSMGKPDLWGFTPDNPRRRELQTLGVQLPVPLLQEAHTPLMEGRYPHQAFDPQELWPWGKERGHETEQS